MTPPPSSLPSILVVDDSPQNLQVAGETLGQNLECELSFATSGQAALDSIAEQRPDLILLDVIMPDMSGVEICRRLKSDPATAGISIIFLTAKSDSEDIVAGFEAGGDDYVTKPFNAPELLARVNTRLQLKKATDTIARKIRDMRHLLQILCHDLANPIASISGMLDFCEDDLDALADVLPDMREITRRALEQIKVVREMHSVEEGRSHLELAPLSLSKALHAAEQNLVHLCRAKEIRIVGSIPPGLEVLVEPVSFVNTVLANLLSNAAKFSFRGSVVTVEAARWRGNLVRIQVRDTGVGMSASKLSSFFVPTTTSSSPGTEGETGTGFGIPLVKSFVEAYGGEVHVASRAQSEHPENHGTTITMYLREA